MRQFHRLPIGERPLIHQATHFTCRKHGINQDARALKIKKYQQSTQADQSHSGLQINWHLIYKYTQTVPKRHTVAIILVMPQSPTPFFPSVTAALITSGQACSFFPSSQINLTKKSTQVYIIRFPFDTPPCNFL